MRSLTRWLLGTVATRKVTRVHVPRDAIRHDETSVMQQRGWRRKGEQYSGPFATPYGTWLGRIEHAGGGLLRVYIKDPPMTAVDRHPKRPCFYRDTHGWWRINLAVTPIDRDANSVILYVERLLTESHRLTGRP